MTRAEKVAEAQEMRRGGALLREIAEAFGVAIQTAHDWLSDPDLSRARARKESYRGTCEDCGAKTTGSNGRAKAPTRCVPCTNAARVVWTREAIIAAIRRFAGRYGRPPGVADFSPAHARLRGHEHRAERFHSDGDYPVYSTVAESFGTWGAGIEAAGFTAFDYSAPRDWDSHHRSERLAA